ncbi:MAG: ABC-F family ATP-binding cassette domain-containing protein [Deltaproteobacteria bacterium]|nr:ABC-F family ATP-binding cassette domain-containing protein [Deltaproteobacteria bacterium]
MNVIVADGIEKSFGDRQVLRGCDLSVGERDRVGLVGVNGSGKSTLLRILAGALPADHGVVHIHGRGRVGLLEQDPLLPEPTVGEAAMTALGWHRELVAEYHRALAEDAFARAASLHDRLDMVGWSVDHQANALLSRVGAPPSDALVANLSGGERRRVALAMALLGAPDLLLLDEPTNHLDADTVEWLQGYLAGYRGAVVVVTHDRYLLEAVAERIAEVEDGRCVAYDDCSYTDYLVARAERRAAMERSEERRLALIRREASWAARSPAARSSRQKARIQRLELLKAQQPLHLEEGFRLDLRSGLRLGSTILEFHDVTKRFGDTRILQELTMTLAPGDRIGVVGPNGAGKTTLLKLVTGEQHLDAGKILRGSRLRLGLLDQHRTGLNDDDTVYETLGGGNDHVKVGERHVHVATLLEHFLFEREMFGQKVAGLSGGERARLLLAKLLLRGANVLLLDEPTDDLDLMTLRVLEEALLDFDGCALIVTHDRAFIDRVCNRLLAFHGEGEVLQYADRLQYLAELKRRRAAVEARGSVGVARRAPTPKSDARGKSLSWKEQRELEALPEQIETLEAERSRLEALLADPETYRAHGDRVAEFGARLKELSAQIDALYERWVDLGDRA